MWTHLLPSLLFLSPPSPQPHMASDCENTFNKIIKRRTRIRLIFIFQPVFLDQNMFVVLVSMSRFELSYCWRVRPLCNVSIFRFNRLTFYNFLRVVGIRYNETEWRLFLIWSVTWQPFRQKIKNKWWGIAFWLILSYLYSSNSLVSSAICKNMHELKDESPGWVT